VKISNPKKFLRFSFNTQLSDPPRNIGTEPNLIDFGPVLLITVVNEVILLLFGCSYWNSFYARAFMLYTFMRLNDLTE